MMEAPWELPEGLREAFADDARDVVDEILALYLQDSEPLIGAILAAHASGDGEALSRLLHRLKGSSSQVGAMRLSTLCLRAESALCDSGVSAPALAECLGSIDDEWPRAAGAIREWLGQNSSA
jgi:HPt (histidine-containing phosphotransfer) domain-containing protein